MADASYQVTSTLGGEISKFAQGRYDRPDYRTCLAICLNGHPIESGTWTRRPGSQFIGATRGGNPGRVQKFDFNQSAAYMLEFTDGFLRYWAGTRWATTNDSQVILAISAANPAVVQTTIASGWTSGNTVTVGNTGSGVPLLQNRQFIITPTDATHFSLTDALTGATIDGSTLGALPAGTTVSRIQESVSPYGAGLWATVRVIQAETTAFLLQATVPPQAVTVTTLPSPGIDAQFALAPCVFNDVPYLDAFTNGVQANPSAKVGVIAITLNFPTFSATLVYAKGAFVTSAGVNYISLVDQNVGSAPPSANWAATSAGAAINNGAGFQGTDVGRLVRLFSEPDLWLVGTAYVAGNIVSYNPSGLPGGATYWTALAGSTGKIPGNDLNNWSLTPGNAAVWSWGKIVSLTNNISGTIAGVVHIGDMTLNGGLAAAFDGTNNKNASVSAARIAHTSYIGQNFTVPGAQKISSVTVYPSADDGLAVVGGALKTLVITLYAKNSLPANGTDGTILGTISTAPGQNANSAFSIASNDQVTTWLYVWVSVTVTTSAGAQAEIFISQIVLFNPAGTGTAAGINVEILGPPLLYTTPIRTWRLGVFSNTTGWPTSGCYHEGRLWLGGVVDNRFDASVSNGIVGGTVNFAPTDQYGTVTAASGISSVLNSDGVNPILWMMPDLQGIIMGTQACEFLVQPPTPGGMTPFNIAGRRVTKIGSANVEPRRTEHTLVFAQRFSRKLMEYFSDVYSGKFTAPNLAQWAMHITKPGVAELAYQQAVVPIIWGRNNDGSLWGITYKRDTLSTSSGPTFAGWHRHLLGPARSITSIAVGPSTGGNLDTLFMVTTDGAVNHVEVLTDLIEEGASLTQAAYCDDAVTPSSTVSNNATPAPYGGLTLNGLWHLNGKTVTAWLAGLDCGDYLVSNGSITVPYGDGVSAGTGSGFFTAAAFVANPTAVVGFTFTSDGQAVRPNSPAESGARSGPALGKKRRSAQAAFQLEGTQGLSVGTLFSKLDPCKLIQDDGTRPAINQTFTGTNWVDGLTNNYSFDSMVCWRVTRPYPANVVAIGVFVQTMDK